MDADYSEVLTEDEMQMIRNGLMAITTNLYDRYTLADLKLAEDLYYKLSGAETITLTR
jgi:hypothetical protein